MASNSDITHKSFPDAEFRFFIFDPYGNDFTYYRCASDRDRASKEVIKQYLDDGWDEAVEQVVAGELSHVCAMVDVVKRPPDDQLDDKGRDAEGRYWGDFDTYCNYALQPLPAAGEAGGA